MTARESRELGRASGRPSAIERTCGVVASKLMRGRLRRFGVCVVWRLQRLIASDGDQVECRMPNAVQTQESVDFAVEKPPHVETTEPHGGRGQIDVLRDVARLEQNKAVSAAAVLEHRALEQRGYK